MDKCIHTHTHTHCSSVKGLECKKVDLMKQGATRLAALLASV